MIRPYSRAFAMITATMYFMILAGCGGGDSGPTSPTPSTPSTPTPPPPPPAPVATSLTVTPSSHTLASIGATVQLSATVRDQNNNPMTGQTVSWTSSNTAVATVNGNGLVTAVSNGTSQITARAGNASGTSNITVAEPVPTRIAVTPSSHTLEAIGETVQLRATVRDQRNNTMSGQTITWSSGDEAVATVDGNGLVTAVSNGMAEITAKSGSLSANAAITVSQAPASIAITPESASLSELGQTVQFMATVSDANDFTIEDAAVSWSSSDESVATVNEAGLVTAVGDGMADITAQAGDIRKSTAIRVFVPSPDRSALVALYNATDGPNWEYQENWLSDEPIESWNGVIVDDTARVTRLLLSNNRLAGEIPVELSQLSHLNDLYLSENQLTGEIPVELVQLKRMKRLHLEDNQLTGSIPPELGTLTELEALWLRGNRLTGNIPVELAQLAQLNTLLLEDNQLTGSIPVELGRLSNLTFLILKENSLTGEIPVELAQLAALEHLSLNDNSLTGSIPSELGQLSQLKRLYLFNNKLTGSIPSELGQLSELTLLNLGNNQLQGSIPPELGQMGKLDILILHHNELTGELPPELGDLSDLELLLLASNAGLTGTLPREFLNLNLNSLTLVGTQICVPPEAEFQAWVAGIIDARGITECEVEDGGEGGEGGDGEGGEEIEYVEWEGVRVERGKLIFSASIATIEITGCFTEHSLIGALLPPEGLKDWTNAFTNDTLTVHYSMWQRSVDMGSTWENIEDTRVMYNACAYDSEVAGEYRLVGEITLNGERSHRRSENTFEVP